MNCKELKRNGEENEKKSGKSRQSTASFHLCGTWRATYTHEQRLNAVKYVKNERKYRNDEAEMKNTRTKMPQNGRRKPQIKELYARKCVCVCGYYINKCVCVCGMSKLLSHMYVCICHDMQAVINDSQIDVEMLKDVSSDNKAHGLLADRR